ncbi:MAG: nicotinate phosphoribosyltransferase [Verrucomicrobia bacterium]|nr:nicotinate phosphoribosyltransferase [Verrucomicrobiota bacterium]MBS0646903.1 nicotinate phosphoribosyltransferase [Verrucomicrobiota bacterium]
MTDLYELTMAHAYWKENKAEDEAVFHLCYRHQPFQGGYAIAAGLASVIDYLQSWHFDESDIAYLASLKAEGGGALFEDEFLHYLRSLKFSCDVDAVVEGEVVFPFEPLIRVQGPLLQAQLLESALLTLTNFSTLIATKAARVCQAADGDAVLEFGLRRAQGVDGAMTASRAAYLGGCASTSNTLAGKWLGIPVAGTHAHSWIMAFDSELESFFAYARAMPHHCVFLVDTYDTLQGVKHAIEVGKWLRKQGHPLLGVRLDSGDLTYLSQKAREMLDSEGFQETKIYASNELSETLIADMKQQGAKIAVWGVGTNLVTGQTQSALDGVYKLSALRPVGSQHWQYKLKFSERMVKISNPGILQVRRFSDESGQYFADALYDVLSPIPSEWEMIDPEHPLRHKVLNPKAKSRDLLVKIFSKGEYVYSQPSLSQSRSYCQKQLKCFDATFRRLCNPHVYPVGMEKQLYDKKMQLVHAIQGKLYQ